MAQTRTAAGDGNGEELKQSVSEARDVLDAAADDTATSDKLMQMALDARDRLNTVLSDLGAKAETADRAMRKRYAQAEASIKSGVANTETHIKENPWRSVGIAAGAGLPIRLQDILETTPLGALFGLERIEVVENFPVAVAQNIR